MAAERPALSLAAKASRELGLGRSLTAVPGQAPRIVGLRRECKTEGLPVVGSTAAVVRAVRVAAVPVGLRWLPLAVARRQGGPRTGRRRAPGVSVARAGRRSWGSEGAAHHGLRTGGGMKADPTTLVGRPVGVERAVRRPRCPVLEERAATVAIAAGVGGQVRRREAVLVLRAAPGLFRRGPGRLEISGGLGRTALLPGRGPGSVEVASSRVEPVEGASRTAAGWAGRPMGRRPGRTAAAQTHAVGLEALGVGVSADPRPLADGKAREGLIRRAQVRPARRGPARRTVVVGHRVPPEAGSPGEEGPRVAALGGASTAMTVLKATLLVGVRAGRAPLRRKDGLKPLALLQPPPSTVG